MSADNILLVVQFKDGWRVGETGFSGYNCGKDSRGQSTLSHDELSAQFSIACRNSFVFQTPEEAYAHAIDILENDVVEYGIDVLDDEEYDFQAEPDEDWWRK